MKKALSLLSLLLVAITMINAQTFTTITTSDNLRANGISSDGKYVTGHQITVVSTAFGSEQLVTGMFAWSEDGGLETWDLANTNYFGLGGIGKAVSPTGRIIGLSVDHEITASVELDNGSEDVNLQMSAFSQIGTTEWTILPFSDNTMISYNYAPYALDITDDGNKIIGAQHPGGEAQRRYAGYWDVTDVDNIIFFELEQDQGPGNMGSEALTTSGDASVIGGYNFVGGWTQTPVLWIYNGTEYEYTNIVGIHGEGMVNGVSNNGHYAALTVDGKAGFYDISREKFIQISSSPSVALAVSNTGVVAGYTGDEGNGFIFTESKGMKTIATFLTESGVEYPSGFSFKAITDISADGKIITGWGTLNGVTQSFIITIPEITDEGIYPINVISIINPSYGTITIEWEAPETTATITGYKIYDENNSLLETLDASSTTYTKTGLSEGTYSYYVTVLYGTEESEKSEIVSIILSEAVSLPFFEEFNASNFNTIGWNANNQGIWGWEIMALGGFPPPCAYFFAPSTGDFSESLLSPIIDASEADELYLYFNHCIVGTSTTEFFKIEIYDGTMWQEVEEMPMVNSNLVFTTAKYNISQYSGTDNLRVRFTVHGTSQGDMSQLSLDNVEIRATEVELVAPLSIEAYIAEDDNQVTLTWTSPTDKAELRYLPSDKWTAGTVGNEGKPFIAANMYPAETLALYDGYKLTSLSFMASTTEGAEYKWYVYHKGERLYDATVTSYNANPASEVWTTVQLEIPIIIDANYPLYYGVEIVSHTEADRPVATSDIFKITDDGYSWHSLNIVDGKGNIYSEDGGKTWNRLEPYLITDEFEYTSEVFEVFCIKATIEQDTETEEIERLSGYRILRNGENVLAKQYNEAYGNIFAITTFIDTNPIIGENTCYEVSAYYTTQEDSEPIDICITVNSISNPISEGKVSITSIQGGYEITYQEDVKTMTVYDVAGKKVEEVNMNDSGVYTYTTSHLTTGIYILRFNEIGVSVKIIK